MGDTQTVDERAEEIAKSIAGEDTEIIRSNHFDGRHEFDYSGGCIQAHRLPDDWSITGFGSKWFSMERTE